MSSFLSSISLKNLATIGSRTGVMTLRRGIRVKKRIQQQMSQQQGAGENAGKSPEF